jgi:putative membrane protein
MHWNGYGWGWHMAGMWIFWILLIVVIVLLFRWLGVPGRGPEAPRESAEEILKKRYARGEIDKEEFDRRLTDLRR